MTAALSAGGSAVAKAPARGLRKLSTFMAEGIDQLVEEMNVLVDDGPSRPPKKIAQPRAAARSESSRQPQ